MSAVTLGESLALHGWENFYVIVGSSAAALTGLTFIVITISSSDASNLARTPESRLRGLRAFITPIAVHFCSALWLSVLLSVPGQTASSLAICLAVTGALGVVYCVRVIRWMLEILADYKPFITDWIWNAILPTFAYLGLLAGALLLRGYPSTSLYVVGAITVLLLSIGIHNAWDVVAWTTTERHAHKYRPRHISQPPRDDSVNGPGDAT